MKNSFPFSAVHPESEDEPLRSTNTSRQNVLSFASCPRYSNSQNHANSVALYKQHRREHFASRARIVKQHRFNRHLPYKLKPEFSAWEISNWDSTRQEFTVRNSSPPSQRVVVLLRAITTHQLRSHWTRLRQLAVRRNTINFNFGRPKTFVAINSSNPLILPQQVLKYQLLTPVLLRLKSRFTR